MNPDRPSPDTIGVYVIGIAGAFLIVFALVLTMQHYMQPASVSQDRSEERRKNLAALRAADTEALESSSAAWLDKAKGIVRLPIQRAMEITIQESQNPAAARSNLIARMEKATFVPPKPPEKPGVYE